VILLEHLARTLTTLLREDERRIVLGEDVADGGLLGLTREAAADPKLATRLVGAPLSPVTALAQAAGAALGGSRPIVVLPSATSLVEGLAGLREAALLGWRLGTPVPLLVLTPCGPGFGLGGDAADAIETLLTTVPGLRTVILGRRHDAPALLRAAASFTAGEGPTVVLLPRTLLLAELAPEDVAGELGLPFGAAVPLRHGTRATVFTWGECVEACERAIEESGHDVTLVQLQTLAPLPRDAVIELARATGRIVIVHRGPRAHGVGAELAATFADEAILTLDAPVVRVTGEDGPFHPPQESAAIPDLASIRAAIEHVVTY